MVLGLQTLQVVRRSIYKCLLCSRWLSCGCRVVGVESDPSRGGRVLTFGNWGDDLPLQVLRPILGILALNAQHLHIVGWRVKAHSHSSRIVLSIRLLSLGANSNSGSV